MFDKKIVVETVRRCKEPLLLYGLFFLPPLFQSRPPTGMEFNHLQFLLISALTALFQILLVCYLITEIGNRTLEQYGCTPFRISFILWGIGGWILLLSLVGLSIFILSHLSDSIQDRLTPPFQWRFFRFDLFPFLLCTLGIGAFFEELFFRGYLYQELRALSVSSIGSAVITTLAFAIGHGYQGEWGIFLAFILGSVLLGLRILTHSLWASVITHWLYNLSVLLLSSIIPHN